MGRISALGQHRLPELRAGCACHLHQKSEQAPITLQMGENLHIRLLKEPLDHRTGAAAFGAEPKQSLGTRNELWEGRALHCVRSSIPASHSPAQPPQIPLLLSPVLSTGSKSTLSNVHVQRSTVIHCPNQLQFSSPTSLHHHHPLLRVLLNIEVRVIPFMASQRLLLILPDGSHKAQRGKDASQLKIWI